MSLQSLTRPACAAVLVFAGVAMACDGRSPSSPSPNAGAFEPKPPINLVIYPSAGPTYGNTPVIITGHGFQAGVHVSFGDAPAIVGTVRPERIDAITQRHEAGPVDVVVTNPDGGIARLAAGYVYEVRGPGPAPSIIAIEPELGSTAGGTFVRITGNGFEPGVSVAFAGLVVRATVDNDQLLFITPPGPAGRHDVIVINPDGQSTTREGGFSYASPASFNLDGRWEGHAGDHWDFTLGFLVHGGLVSGVTCDGNTLTFTTPVSVLRDTFSVTEQGRTVFEGAFSSESAGAGKVLLEPCLQSGGATFWYASKIAR